MTWINRGKTFSQKGDLEAAIKDFTRATEADPKAANAFFERGNSFAKKDDLEPAIRDYTSALQINPKHLEAYSNRAVAYFGQSNFEKALQDAKRCRALGGELPQRLLEALAEKFGKDALREP